MSRKNRILRLKKPREPEPAEEPTPESDPMTGTDDAADQEKNGTQTAGKEEHDA